MKKTYILLSLITVLVLLTSCGQQNTKDNSSSNSTSVTEVMTEAAESESIQPDKAFDAPNVAETPDIIEEAPLPDVGDDNFDYYQPCNYALDSIPGYLSKVVVPDETEWSAWTESFKNSEAPSKLTDYANVYSLITDFDVSDELVREIYAQHDDMSEDDVEVLLSRDEKAILAHFASDYSIVIDDRVYSPQWIYEHTAEDYILEGITSEMLSEKLDKYELLGFSSEATNYLNEKLLRFIEPGNESVYDYDYSCQINEEGDSYEFKGRVSDYPIVIGEHEHPDCDDTNAEFMALGQEKLEAAAKLYRIIRGLVPTDSSKFIYDEYDNEVYALDEEFGTYGSIMELCNNTFAPDAGEWHCYYSVESPEELLDSGFVGLVIDGANKAPTLITEVLDRAMSVEDGITYKMVYGGYNSHRLQTKIIGVMNHTNTHIEYRLCTMVLDESAEALAVSVEIPQVFFEHSVMKLELVDGKWLVTQIRDDLGNEVSYNEVFIANNGLEF